MLVFDDELLDIVDNNDVVIGQKLRSAVYAQSIKNFRVVNAFVVNSKNQVWIPLRSPHKKLFPSCLDTSVGGHVAAGETYEFGFRRELQEELNLCFDEISCTMIAHLNPYQHNLSAFMNLYLIRTDVDPEYNKDDFVSAAWYSIDQLRELMKQKAPMKGDLPILITILSHYL